MFPPIAVLTTIDNGISSSSDFNLSFNFSKARLLIAVLLAPESNNPINSKSKILTLAKGRLSLLRLYTKVLVDCINSASCIRELLFRPRSNEELEIPVGRFPVKMDYISCTEEQKHHRFHNDNKTI